MKNNWLLAIDLDGTVWNHKDISAVPMPYKKISDGVIENNDGIRITVYPEALEFIKWARKNGGIITSLSWNIPENAMQALKVLGIDTLFDYHLIEYHPDKYRLLLKLLNELEKKNITIPPGRIVYVDDRDIHIQDIRKNIGNIIFIHIWREVKDFEDAKKIIYERIIKS